MLIVVKSGRFDNDCRSTLRIEVDGKERFSATDGEPEDNNLYRNFSDCDNIPSLMRSAYEAGKRRETFDIKQIELKEEDI